MLIALTFPLTLLLVFAFPALGQETCQNPRVVAALGPTTNDDRTSFQTTGHRFLVSYEVDFVNDDPIAFRDFTVRINDRFGLVESDSTDQDAKAGFIVPV